MSGIALAAPPGFTDWLAQGHDLLARRTQTEWELADWLATGREAFGNQAAFDFLGDELGIDPKRLKSAVKVAGLFPPALRAAGLTFEHHELVASSSLPMAERLDMVSRADRDRWKPSELRTALVQARFCGFGERTDDDLEEQEYATILHAWNKARPDARQRFLDLAKLANLKTIDDDEVMTDGDD